MSHNLREQMQTLYRQFGEVAGIHIELHKELLAVRVENEQATATVFLQGAQLSDYRIKQPGKQQQPIIWCSPQCDYLVGQPLRGGIPVCWPWFGELARNPHAVQQQIPETALQQTTAPAHGFVRNRNWQLTQAQAITPHLTRLQLELKLAAAEEPLWPYATDLRLTIDIGATLLLTFAIINRSSQSVNFSAALHSYFAISDIDQVAVDGLQSLSYIDCMANWETKRQQGLVTIDAELDRIYSGTHNGITLIDKDWQHSINLRTEGSNSAILWNPWQEKARRLSQFPDSAYREMLCIESANAGDDCVALATGETHKLCLTISQSRLN
jgi:glucose-6-phosphate 1-epimerase